MPVNTPYDEPTLVVVGPNGERERVLQSDVPAAVGRVGWDLEPGQQIVARADHTLGEEYATSLEGYQARGGMGLDQRQLGQGEIDPLYQEQELRKEWGDSEGLALLAGAGRGLTFGLSDLALTESGLVEEEDLGALQEYNPVSSAVGEFGSIIGTGILGAGKGLVGAALRATPAGKVAAAATRYGQRGTGAFIKAQAAEGALYGMGQKISQMAISDEPLTGDRILMELLEGGAIGGGLGAAGGAVFKGASKLNKMRQPKPVAPPHFDINTSQGQKFLGGMSDSVERATQYGDEVYETLDPISSRQFAAGEISELKQYSSRAQGYVDDVLGTAENEIAALGRRLEGLPEATKRFEAARRALAAHPNGGLDEIDAMRRRLTKAIHVKKSADGRYLDDASRPPWLEKLSLGADQPLMDSRRLDELMAEYRAMLRATPTPVVSAGGVVTKESQDAIRSISAAKQSYADAADLYDDLIMNVRPSRDRIIEAAADARKRLGIYKQGARTQAGEFAKAQEALKNAESTGPIAGDSPLYARYMRASHERFNDFPSVVLGRADELNRMLPRQVQGGAEVLSDMGKFSTRRNEILARINTPVPEGSIAARSAYRPSKRALEKALGGKVTPQSMSRVFTKGTPDEVSRMVQAVDDHRAAIMAMAKTSNDPAMVESATKMLAKMDKHIMSSIPAETLEASKHINLNSLLSNEKVQAVAGLSAFAGIADEGPLDTLSKVAIIGALFRSGKGSKAMQEATLGAAESATKSRGMLTGLPGSMGGYMARSQVSQKGLGGAAIRAGAGHFGRRAMNAVTGHAGLFKASGRATGAVQQAVGRLMGGVGKSLMGGAGAAATLKLLHFAEEEEVERKERESELQSLFNSKAKSLRKLSANPQALQQVAYDSLQPLREVHPYLADKVEVGKARVLQMAYDALPKDPGTQHMMGVSTWQPDEFQIQEFANFVQGLVKPFSVLDGVMDGSITMAGAKAFRQAYPPTFAALQMEIARNVPELQKKLTYDQQDRLATFMGVPINSTTTPEYSQFIVQRHMEEAAASTEAMGQVDANALIQGTPTQAQNLLNRGNKRT